MTEPIDPTSFAAGALAERRRIYRDFHELILTQTTICHGTNCHVEKMAGAAQERYAIEARAKTYFNAVPALSEPEPA